MAVLRNKIVGDLSGSVGGMTFSKNRSGGIVKFKSTNKNPNTTKQAQNRNRFSAHNSSWHTLSDAEKMAWNEFGLKNNESGLNSFIKLNFNISSYKSNLFLSAPQTTIFYNSSASGSTILNNIYRIKNPPVFPFINSVNNSSKFIKSGSIIPSSGSGFKYEFIINYSDLDSSAVPKKIVMQWLKDSVGRFLFFKLNYRLISSQKSNYNNNPFSNLINLNSRSSNTNFTGNLLFSRIRISTANLSPKIVSLGLNNKEIELQFVIMNSDGQEFTLNNQYFTFSF